jgi:hypothetical protein
VDWGFGLSIGAFTFVSYDHFTDHHAWRYQPHHAEIVNIYNHSTIIKNTVIVNKTTIINHGIPKDKIVGVTHKPIQTVSLRDSNTATHGRMEHVGGKNTLAVYRPTPTTIARAATTPGNHNKPVFINSAARTPVNSSSHSAFNAPGRTSANHSPISSPKASTHDWASTSRSTPTPRPVVPKTTSPAPNVHQAWPAGNTSRSSIPHASPAATEKVASANNNRPSFEPGVHSSLPAKTVEQPNNYFGSGAYHHSAPSANSSAGHVTPSHSAPTHAAPSYSPGNSGRGNFGGASVGGRSFGGSSRSENGHNR